MDKQKLEHDLKFAKIDYDRQRRTGACEVVFCEGKKAEHIAAIAKDMSDNVSTTILLTRASPEVFEAVSKAVKGAQYFEDARIIVLNEFTEIKSDTIVAVISAGTADFKVAEEAAISLSALGHQVKRYYDVGVAGVHRLIGRMDEINEAGVLIVVAGMEGALASVVGGLTDKPVVAVPTSIGYGANFGGLSALLAMLNSCATGVAVVNIDNGFGAAMFAHKIIRGRK